MKFLALFATFPLLLTTLSRAASDPALASADVGSDAGAEKQIRTALAQWTQAANRGDWKTALQIWAPDLIGWTPEGTQDSYRREADLAAQAHSTKAQYSLVIDEIIVEGSLAVVRDTWTETLKREGQEDKINIFRSFEIWRRQPDRLWKISRWIDTAGPAQTK